MAADTVKATWVGPPDHFLAHEDGSTTPLVPHETVRTIGRDEAQDSAHWAPVPPRAKKGDS